MSQSSTTTEQQGVTNDRLTSIVFRLANQFPVRHYLHKGPSDNPSSHCEVHCYLLRGERFPTQLVAEMKAEGFEEDGFLPDEGIFDVLTFRAKRDLRTEGAK